MTLIRAILATAAASAAVFVVTAAGAQQDVVKSRQDLMKRSGQQMAVVNRMVRGQEAFDAAKVNAAFDAFADKAQKLPSLFPAESRKIESRALPKIWDDPKAWNAEVAKFAKNVADGRAKAVSGVDGLKAAVAPLVADCSSCHEGFRRPAQR